jgi:uncharacterized damage-inducible protein DinB
MTADLLGARLAAQGEALERMVSRTSAEHFERRPQADKWSAREHLAHLACYQQRFLERLGAILSRDRPSFQRYRAEEDEDWPEWQRLASDEIHERLQARRRELLTLVASLSESQLERVGLHPVFGAMTIPQWIDFFLFHEGHHAYQVMALAMRGPA